MAWHFVYSMNNSRNFDRKAPDKIFIHPVVTIANDGRQLKGYTYTYECGDSEEENDVVYIRKDLLLEWAGAMKILCEEHPAHEHGNWHDGNANAYGKLIYKLNSL